MFFELLHAKMDENHKKVIDKHIVAVVNDMDAFNIAVNLQSKQLLSDHDVDTIMTERTDMERRRRLLVILKTKGNTAFNLFMKALQDTGQNHLSDLLVSETPMAASGSTSSPNSFDRVQDSMKEMYLQRFKKVNPFSLPFTFDIENTWVSLALRGHNSKATEDHASLLKSAFEKEKMLIIEGKPATGKTSLMRRLAYEWAIGEQKLAHYELVLYAEFREVREKEFETVTDLVLEYFKKYNNFVNSEVLKGLEGVLNDQGQKILILLDGYDESYLYKQCKELTINYFQSSTIQSPLFFNIVLTTRPGYLGQYRGNEGRYIFADVLGFITEKQKEKYILNHFKSLNIGNKENIEAVHRLLKRNENMNELAETPLFLTFICLVHERIQEGTVLELYCNTIWWLIDRHQKDFPDRDIPSLFEFQASLDKDDKFEIIQDHYHQFPQLHCLGKMGVNSLIKDVFHDSDYDEYGLKPIVEKVGLLRKERQRHLFVLKTTFFFPHRTIQEFLAALYIFCSKEELNLSILGTATPNSELDTSKMTQYQTFLLQFALSDDLPIISAKRQMYFERITNIKMHLTFQACTTIKGLNNKLLNSLFSQCKNVRSIEVHGYQENIRQNGYPHYFRLNYEQKDLNRFSRISDSLLLILNNLIHLGSITFVNCTLLANSELSFKNCTGLKKIKLRKCRIQHITKFGIARLEALDTLEFELCHIDLEAWESIIEEIKSSSVKCLKLSPDCFKYLESLQKCNKVEAIFILSVYQCRMNDKENVVQQLINLARTMQSLKGIGLDYRQCLNYLNKSDKQLIEEAGQERDPTFSISIFR